jgi:T-complex protein 1 subunit gamma
MERARRRGLVFVSLSSLSHGASLSTSIHPTPCVPSLALTAGELLAAAEPFLARNMHPTVIIRGYTLALETALKAVRAAAFDVDPADRPAMLSVLTSCLGTKFSSRFGPLIAGLALDAVRTVAVPPPPGSDAPPEVDIKRYAKVEKLPGGDLSDSRVLSGVMFAKDVVAPGRMARTLRRPRILLLDCPLEYKKGESQTNVEVTKEEDWAALLQAEEDAVARLCADVAAAKPDLVITEKGISDLAVHCLSKAGIVAIRRVRKTDNNRIARATGATIVHR